MSKIIRISEIIEYFIGALFFCGAIILHTNQFLSSYQLCLFGFYLIYLKYRDENTENTKGLPLGTLVFLVLFFLGLMINTSLINREKTEAYNYFAIWYTISIIFLIICIFKKRKKFAQNKQRELSMNTPILDKKKDNNLSTFKRLIKFICDILASLLG